MNGAESGLVSVIVPTYNRRDRLFKCLQTIYASKYSPLEVIVVDDCSSVDLAQDITKAFPNARVLRNPTRMLLAASRNRGIRNSRGEYIMFVDDDNLIEENAIGELMKTLDAHLETAVAAPVVYYVADPERIWFAGSWMSPASAIAVFPYRGRGRPPLQDPYPTGLFHDVFMARRSLFDAIGVFDEKNFPIYLSEADFSERMKLKGFRAFVVPSAKVWHDVPILGGFRSLLRHTHMTEPVRAYHVARNRIIFVKKYRGLPQKLLFTLFFLPILTMMHSLLILSSKHTRRIYLIRYYLGGVIAGLAATP